MAYRKYAVTIGNICEISDKEDSERRFLDSLLSWHGSGSIYQFIHAVGDRVVEKHNCQH